MSTSSPIAEKTPPKKPKKNRDEDGEKSSKKRKRQEAVDTVMAEQTPQSSPSKKPRRDRDVLQSIEGPQAMTETPFFTQTTSLYLSLSPVAQRKPLEGLCAEHLSPLLLTYYPSLRGIVLAYSNPRLSQTPPRGSTSDAEPPVYSRIVDEFAVTYVWLTADFTLLKATRGAKIEGHVTVQSPNHIGLVCWNLFSASIERKRLPKSWKWSGRSIAQSRQARRESGKESQYQQDDSDGHFLNERGEKVEGVVEFRLKDFDITPELGKEKGFTSIEGTMLSDKEEKLLEKELEKDAKQVKILNRRLPGLDAVVDVVV
jgi:DNA-directed RNA polymerase I subunit RPA43